ncbi:hydroquinone glucosyltransferase-like [Triticum urartu]|nr:hydroquinone glucosyltransferase-like [Triticum urartu]XP_048560548.1 hydroquinone glucosyltransferase-like [Triticum urartu]
MASLSSMGSASAAAAPPAERLAARPHVILLASPGAGHLIPLAELARRLVELHGFAATIVTFTNFSAPELLACLPASVATVALPAVQMDDLPKNGGVLVELTRRSLPNIRALVRSISNSTSTAPLAALVADFMCSTALPIAAELGVPGYLFVPSNLAHVALTRYVIEINEGVAPGEYRDLAVPLELPGGVSLRHADLPDGYRSKHEGYVQTVEWSRCHCLGDGVLVNTFYEMEPATVEAFKQLAVPEQGSGAFFFPPVFPVGPSVRRPDRHEPTAGEFSPCLEWLDRQPAGSVVYVAFGSRGALSVEQTAELAAGLETSGQRFLWVVRMPSTAGGDDPLAWLPEGFLARTSGRGLAVAAWAPQVRVLAHPATAAFVSHCGWNSTLESVGCGVPMLAWPLYAEQRMNALLLEQNLGMALRVPPSREDGRCLVTRHEIAKAVKELMEGDQKVRRRAEDLQKAAARAWLPEGPSRRALEEVAVKWKAALGTAK